jgi:hypothetical protein
MDMKIFLAISKVCNLFERIIKYFFLERPGQKKAFFIGLIMIGLSYFLKKYSFFDKLFLSIGCSIIASALIVRLLESREESLKNFAATGIRFVGDREYFDREIKWDKWIRSTNRAGKIIIIGKKNTKWITNSYNSLQSVLKRGIEINFLFMGTKEEIVKNYKVFYRLIKQYIPNYNNYRELIKCYYFLTSDSFGDFGFYWNGNQLIVKLYLALVDNVEAPMIVFDTSFATPQFDILDFTQYIDALPFSEPKILSKIAIGFDSIWDKKKEIPHD